MTDSTSPAAVAGRKLRERLKQREEAIKLAYWLSKMDQEIDV